MIKDSNTVNDVLFSWVWMMTIIIIIKAKPNVPVAEEDCVIGQGNNNNNNCNNRKSVAQNAIGEWKQRMNEVITRIWYQIHN